MKQNTTYTRNTQHKHK